MDSLLKADIFFFISAIGIIILFIILIIALYFAIKFLRHAEYIANKIRTESDNISRDIAELRADIKDRVQQSKMGLGSILGLLGGIFGRKQGSSSAKKTKAKKTVKHTKVVETDEE